MVQESRSSKDGLQAGTSQTHDTDKLKWAWK